MNNFFFVALLTSLSAHVEANNTDLSPHCFESMATIYTQSKIENARTSSDTAIINTAKKDAYARALKLSKVRISDKTDIEIKTHRDEENELSGLFITLGTKPDREYSTSFLYTYSSNQKALRILSAQVGDDQAPELIVYCVGYAEGSLVEKF